MSRGTLHAGKPDDARRRRNAPTHDTIRLVRDDEVRGPSITEALDGFTPDEGWLPQVLKWWDTWRRSPNAQVFEDTDWQRLAVLAPIVQSYWKRPSAAALSEIRMNEERLGATVVDRMRARMRIESPDDGTDAPVLRLATARDDIAARLAADAGDE